MTITNPFTHRVEPGDTVLVNREGTSYQVDIYQLFDSPTPNDVVLVNYQGTSYKVPVVDIPSTTKDSALVLVNRGGTSYRATLGDLRGVAVQDVTFDVEIRTPEQGWNFTGNSTCSNSSGTVPGGKITAQVTAKSNDTFSFSNGTLYINNEWILVCGASGEWALKNDWVDFGPDAGFGVCAQAGTNNDMISKGLSAIGVNTIGPGGPRQNWGNGPGSGGSGSFGWAGAGGYGCPPGPTGSPGNTNSPGVGGGSQSRPRAENTGDTWNEIIVRNIVHSTGNWSAYHAITGYGKTFTNSSGVIGDLLE